MLQPGQQVERLQAVDAERLEKVGVRLQLLPRNFEVRGGEGQDLIERLVSGSHRLSSLPSAARNRSAPAARFHGK